ncbi:MAG: biotin--[acetyl-CoA-carboxylase] ligase [Isosphaeraceae bacterium]
MNIALIRQLRNAGGRFLPLEVLCSDSDLDGLTRELDELEAFGFLIERHPERGAAFRGPPRRLCPDQIEFELNTRRIGRRIAVWDRVSSTNDLALRAASSTANDGLVVLAEEQTDGRGRRGRKWRAPPRSSILMSVSLFPQGSLAEPASLTALGAVAVADVVSEWTRSVATIKWPNDVRVDGRKVAGILVERGSVAVIGIGLNVNLAPDDFPEELRETATSVRILRGTPVDRSELARDLIRRLDDLYDESRRDGAALLSTRWRERIEHFGRQVAVTTLDATLFGRLQGLDLWEGLCLESRDGTILQIPARQIQSITPT